VSRVHVHGFGAVSPAGWGVEMLRDALNEGRPLPTKPVARPGWEKALNVRPVPTPAQRPGFLGHPRLRRSSLITQHTVAAAIEALGQDLTRIQAGELRLGIVVCVMSGCVSYSRRFFEEVLKDPATASPLVFPETVFNAPGSHLAAYLNAVDASYTLVGDDSAFLQALVVAAGWLANHQVEGCLVVGAEELDWLVADALNLFHHDRIQGAGAGALYLRREPSEAGVELQAVTDAFAFSCGQEQKAAVQSVRAQLADTPPASLLCLGSSGRAACDAAELAAWQDWTGSRIAPRLLLGEAFTAATAWQCVAACDALVQGRFQTAVVSAPGTSEQSLGARFGRTQ